MGDEGNFNTSGTGAAVPSNGWHPSGVPETLRDAVRRVQSRAAAVMAFPP